MTIYLFRHGMAIPPNERYGSRVLTAELLPEGIAPIRRLGQYLVHVESDYQVVPTCCAVARPPQLSARRPAKHS